MKNSQKLKWLFLSVASGFLAGIAASIFLILLDLVTKYRQAHVEIIWMLPLAGLIIGWVYFRFGRSAEKGTNLIFEEIHTPQNITPLRMAPFVLFGTILTHLFGGSAGREGTAVQMGASLSDQLAKYFQVSKEERKKLLMIGAGAGFGAAVGAPWAGSIFGMEMIHIGRFRLAHIFESVIASFVGFYTTKLFHSPHTHYPQVNIPTFELKVLFYVSVIGICFGLTARIFSLLTHTVENLFSKIKYLPLKPLIGGIVLVVFFYYEGTYLYAGLGLETIQHALIEQVTCTLPALKLIFTAITIGSGFKGGEFIPLVFIGTTLGSALAAFIPLMPSFLGALGFAGVFAGASNTPLACAVMAMEIFGYEIGLYALIATMMSYYFSGHKGIYKSQRILNAKILK